MLANDAASSRRPDGAEKAGHPPWAAGSPAEFRNGGRRGATRPGTAGAAGGVHAAAPGQATRHAAGASRGGWGAPGSEAGACVTGPLFPSAFQG